MSSVERYAINISNWKGKRPIPVVDDLASFGLEAGRTSWEKRINPVVVNLNDFGLGLIKEGSRDPEDIATGRIFQWAKETPPAIKIWTESSSPVNQEILEGMASFADFNPGRLMIWISPPTKGIYKESRIVIYQPIEINGEKYLFLRGLCGGQSAGECLEIASELLPFTTPGTLNRITDPEQLRATPLSLSLPPSETYTGFFRQYIDSPEVWRAIAQGEDLREKRRALAVAEEIVRNNYHRIVLAKTPEEQYLVGSAIERQLARGLGYTLQSGPCGRLYSDMSVTSLLNEVLSSGTLGAVSFLKGEGSKFIHNCGACGHTLMRLMSRGDHCPYCGGTYEGC